MWLKLRNKFRNFLVIINEVVIEDLFISFKWIFGIIFYFLGNICLKLVFWGLRYSWWYLIL